MVNSPGRAARAPASSSAAISRSTSGGLRDGVEFDAVLPGVRVAARASTRRRPVTASADPAAGDCRGRGPALGEVGSKTVATTDGPSGPLRRTTARGPRPGGGGEGDDGVVEGHGASKPHRVPLSPVSGERGEGVSGSLGRIAGWCPRER